MENLNQTPNADRTHIGIFGKRNSGKSSLINAITNQATAVVSDFAGTTTDLVYKAMEVRDLGACVFIDTPGFDDIGELGALRIEKTELAIKKSDIAIMLFSDENVSVEMEWVKKLQAQKTPIIPIISKHDVLTKEALCTLSHVCKSISKKAPILLSTINNTGIDEILNKLAVICTPKTIKSLTKHLVDDGDTVMLVMPQDSEAPKGRLILPQVQTIRDLLDNNCVITCCTEKNYTNALKTLSAPPALIITDSQVFQHVYENKPPKSKLTSFSVLMADAKGDLVSYIKGAQAIDKLNGNSRILIAEACTHAPLTEDIGRVKIPAILRKRYGESLQIDIVNGINFPSDLKQYSLIIHCGGCMFTRRYLMTRINAANNSNVPITNYGIALAKLNGILEKIVY